MENSFIVTEDLYANHGLRFANFIVDRILFYIAIFALMMLIGLLLEFSGESSDAFFYELENVNSFVDIVVTNLIFAALYFSSEGLLKGRTVGKYLTGTKVVDKYGNTPSIGVLIKRSLSRLIPFNAFSFLGSNARGWHDSISETYVVKVKDLDHRKKTFSELDQIGTSNEL